MSVATIAPVESTIHTTNVWLKELMEELGWDDRYHAYRRWRLCCTRCGTACRWPRQPTSGAQLPTLIRGFYYEGWTPAGKPIRRGSAEDFLAQITEAFPGNPDVFPEAVAWAVFKVLERRVSPGEIGDILHALPPSIRSLWPAPEAAAAG